VLRSETPARDRSSNQVNGANTIMNDIAQDHAAWIAEAKSWVIHEGGDRVTNDAGNYLDDVASTIGCLRAIRRDMTRVIRALEAGNAGIRGVSRLGFFMGSMAKEFEAADQRFEMARKAARDAAVLAEQQRRNNNEVWAAHKARCLEIVAERELEAALTPEERKAKYTVRC
jgi:hypothetical protein